jgi:hypothetical protein
MKLLTVLAVLLLVGCGPAQGDMTYEQLVNYPTQCAKASSQLYELRNLQAKKNFDPDPDRLSEMDRKYNARLKATIWWYAYKCDQS